MLKSPFAQNLVSKTTLASGDVYDSVCMDVYLILGCGGADAEHSVPAVPPEPVEVDVPLDLAEGTSETEHSGSETTRVLSLVRL